MNENTVVWSDDFSVSFEPIDIQHKWLVNMVNELFESCEQGAAAADVAFFQAIKKAADYAKVHFADEEKYMQQSGYPDLGEHRKQHDDFVAAVLKAMSEFETGNTAPIKLAEFLKDWLLNHIAIYDKKFAPYVSKLSV